MFKPEHYDEMKSLLSEFDWQLMISDPNKDDVQEWVAKVNGLLWEFDSPSANEFQKKVDSLVNMWGGVKAGTLPNYDLNFDLNDIKQFLRIKVEGMRRLKDNPTKSIGILNKGMDNTFDSNTFSGLDIGIVDEGQRTKGLGNSFHSKQALQNSSFGNITISGGTVVFGDGAKITQVAVKELVNALSEEIKETVPESEEKKSVLKTLKDITTNETFATVAGTVIGEILRRVTKP